MKPNAWIVLALMVTVKGDTILEDETRSEARLKIISVSAGSFNESYLERLARAELAQTPRVPFFRLRLYGNGSGEPLPNVDHVTYTMWRRFYDEISSKPFDIGEMIAINGNAVLRVRRSDGSLTRKVLVGNDPLLINVRGQEFELLYLTIRKPIPDILTRTDIYVRTTGVLRPDSGLELLRSLERFFPEAEVAVFVRNDSWFIYESNYPVHNPFESGTPPSATEYSRTSILRCNHWSGAASCELR